jgi:hypothetical protein
MIEHRVAQIHPRLFIRIGDRVTVSRTLDFVDPLT